MAGFFNLGEMILITPDLSSISIGLDTSDEHVTQTITVAENKLTSTGYNFGNVDENIYVNSSEDGKELLVKNGYKIKYVEYPKTVGNGGTSYKPGTTFNSVRDSTKTTYISIEAASSKVSIDLTTLTGWDNVTAGEHQISVVAKASGYKDSEKSAAISFTKASVSTGETWVLNDNISPAKTLEKTEINFTSNNTQYTALQYKRSTLGYYTADGSLIDIADADIMDETTSWTNVAYKTITFNTVPTGDLLTWLQANGTKQGGGTTTAHKLTWSDSTMLVTVNGNAATSPYTLANGDTIVLKRTSGYQSYNIITDTGSFDTDTTQSPLAVNNSDIKLQNGEIDMSPSVHMGFTINYTE